MAGRERRLLAGLTAHYRHLRETERIWAHVLRDAESSAVIRQVAESRFLYLREVTAVLSKGWAGRLARAAVAHAARFHTWQSLARAEGLSDEDAAGLMASLVVAVERRRTPTGSSSS